MKIYQNENKSSPIEMLQLSRGRIEIYLKGTSSEEQRKEVLQLIEEINDKDMEIGKIALYQQNMPMINIFFFKIDIVIRGKFFFKKDEFDILMKILLKLTSYFDNSEISPNLFHTTLNYVKKNISFWSEDKLLKKLSSDVLERLKIKERDIDLNKPVINSANEIYRNDRIK